MIVLTKTTGLLVTKFVVPTHVCQHELDPSLHIAEIDRSSVNIIEQQDYQ